MLSLSLALLAAASPLSDGIARYGDLDYEGCVAALAPAVPKLRGGQKAQAEMYLGLCLFALGKEGEGKRHLETALRLEPNLKAPSAASPKEREVFDAVAQAVEANPRPSGQKKTTKLQSEVAAVPPPPPPPVVEAPPPVVEAPPPTPPATLTPAPTPAPSAVVAEKPAPVKRRSFAAPLVFTGLTVAVSAAAVGVGLSAIWHESAAREEPVQIPAGAELKQAQTFAVATNVLWAVAGATALTAAVLWLVSAL